MPSLAEIEAEKYDVVWSSPPYRVKAHGLDLWERQRSLFPAKVDSALDVGCGHGRLMARWLEEGIDAYGIDIVDGLDEQIRQQWPGRFKMTPIWDFEPGRVFDLGVAADVLEHLPTEMVDQSLRAIGKVCRVFVCQNAEFESLHLGHTLHLTVQPAAWWRARMEAIGGRVEQLPFVGRLKRHILRWEPA